MPLVKKSLATINSRCSFLVQGALHTVTPILPIFDRLHWPLEIIVEPIPRFVCHVALDVAGRSDTHN